MGSGKSVRIFNIRKKRNKPGLLRQHLTCVRAAKEICNGFVQGDFLGSEEVIFVPQTIKPGDYSFKISTSGSTSLVFQTIFLPLALSRQENSRVSFEGGTHNPGAPALDFIVHSYLDAVKHLGLEAAVNQQAYGFFPAGGGAWNSEIKPVNLSGVNGSSRVMFFGEARSMLEPKITLRALSSNLRASINEREINHFCHLAVGYSVEVENRQVTALGQGNALVAEIEMGGWRNVFVQLGQSGLSAERVAEKLFHQCMQFINSGAQVSEYLTDQLMLPLALTGGGQFTTHNLSLHAKTNADVIKMFGGCVRYKRINPNLWMVIVDPVSG